MTKENAVKIKYAIGLGGIGILITIVLTNIVPAALFPLSVSQCVLSSVNKEIFECVPKNNIWTWFDQIIGSIGLWLMPILIGVILGLVYTVKINYRYLVILGTEIVTIATFLLGMATWEILHYRPWVSTPYNHYTLNALYGTPVSILFFFLSVVAFNITVFVSRRFWSKFQPLSFLHQNTPTK